MSNQEVGRTGTEERPPEQPQATGAPGPTATFPPEQPVRQAAQAPFPPPYAPYARPGYYPGPGPQPVYGPVYGPPPRRRSPWPWILLIVFLVLAVSGLATLFFAAVGYNIIGYTTSSPETRNFTVSTTPTTTVVITNDIGSIHVKAGGTGSEVVIQATKYTGLGSDVNDVQVRYNQDSVTNTITVNVDRLTSFNFFTSPKVDFVVTVPSNAALQLHADTGSIDVSGVSGQMLLTSNTGSVEARDGLLIGSSKLSSNTGSITFNGSIDKSGSYQFTTNTGSVNVTLPVNSAFHVDANTNTGSITSDFPGVIVEHPNFTGAVAHSDVGSSPQATVIMSTNTGSINLHQS